MKRCRICAEEKPLAHFHVHHSTKGGYRNECRVCFNLATKNAKYLKRYGITFDQAERMKERGCEVCGSKSKLCIDHNHDTGEIRGVLCNPCNRGIGYLGDHPERLEAASAYLRERGHYGAAV